MFDFEFSGFVFDFEFFGFVFDFEFFGCVFDFHLAGKKKTQVKKKKKPIAASKKCSQNCIYSCGFKTQPKHGL